MTLPVRRRRRTRGCTAIAAPRRRSTSRCTTFSGARAAGPRASRREAAQPDPSSRRHRIRRRRGRPSQRSWNAGYRAFKIKVGLRSPEADATRTRDLPGAQAHGDPFRGLSQRLSGPRSRHLGRTRARCRRPLPRHARHQYQQCRRTLRFIVAFEQGRGPYSWLLCRSRRDPACGRRVHEHHADPGLSQLRPAGSDLRDRTAGRHRRRRVWHGSRRIAAQEPGAAGSDALPERGRHAL